MNYESNKEFVNYYINNVLKDLQPMISGLNEEMIVTKTPYSYLCKKIDDKGNLISEYIYTGESCSVSRKYNMTELFEIFEKHIDTVEYEKFTTILNIGWCGIYRWLIYDCSDNFLMSRFESKYKQYFRDQKRHEKNKNKKYIKEFKNKIFY